MYRLHKRNTPRLDSSGTPPGLSLRLVEECARMCIEAAQGVVSLIDDLSQPDERYGVLPWWYRVYYLHMASTIFLASMVTPNLYTTLVAASWQSAMSALHLHAHLSTYIPRAIRNFDTLWTRILGEHNSNLAEGDGMSHDPDLSHFNFDEIFQDVGFDINSFLFGIADKPELYPA